MINSDYSESISVPYYYDFEKENTDPTAWVMNYNWRNYYLLWCTARDCEATDCTAPFGCFTGTSYLNFIDAEVICDRFSGNENKCAKSINDCVAGVNLKDPLICSGNGKRKFNIYIKKIILLIIYIYIGIPRIKDFTGEEYCACGTPISSTISISNVTQESQLKNNGYGKLYDLYKSNRKTKYRHKRNKNSKHNKS